jgi:methyltransferase family protein
VNTSAFLRDPLPAALASLPALVRPVEQQLLYNLARHHYSGRGEVVELGAFFGASTAALAAGLQDHASLAGRRQVSTFDRFDCAAGSMFADLVRRYAAAHALEPLLNENDGRLDFFRCFEHVTRGYAPWIAATRAELSQLRWAGGIELLHVDMPKTYAQLREAVLRTYAFLLPSAFVVVQDFLYHWSAELIAATVAMMQRALLAPMDLIETSLVLRATRAPDAADAAWLDAQMRDPQTVAALLDEAVGNLDGLHARAIVLLAAAQYSAAQLSMAQGEAMIDKVLVDSRGSPFAADIEARAREIRAWRFVLPD